MNAPSKIENFDEWPSLSNQQVLHGIEELSKFCSEERLSKMNKVLNTRSGTIRFVFENPSNANNVWAALRTFDSFGIQNVDIIIDESRYAAKWRKGTMVTALGTQKWLTLRQHSKCEDCLDQLRKEGYTIIASDLQEKSISINQLDWKTDDNLPTVETPTSQTNNHQKFAIVMGNEESGISDTMREQADQLFFIPMKGFAESLNLSAASAVICATLENKGVLRPSLDPETKTRTMLTWLSRSVVGSLMILRRAGIPVKGDSVYNKIGDFTTKP